MTSSHRVRHKILRPDGGGSSYNWVNNPFSDKLPYERKKSEFKSKVVKSIKKIVV